MQLHVLAYSVCTSIRLDTMLFTTPTSRSLHKLPEFSMLPCLQSLELLTHLDKTLAMVTHDAARRTPSGSWHLHMGAFRAI